MKSERRKQNPGNKNTEEREKRKHTKREENRSIYKERKKNRGAGVEVRGTYVSRDTFKARRGEVEGTCSFLVLKKKKDSLPRHLP